MKLCWRRPELPSIVTAGAFFRPEDTVKKSPDLLRLILSLPSAQLWDLFDRLAGRPEVVAAGWRLSERRPRAERYPARNAEIRRRKAEGWSYGQLALHYGLSRSAVVRIVRAGRRKVDAPAKRDHRRAG